jgi:hypothetical protein
MEEKRVLTRDEVIAAIEKRHTEVERIAVPEWGGDVCVRRMSPEDIENSGLADQAPGRPKAGLFAKVMAAALTDESGEPLFDEESAAVLAKADMITAARVFTEILKVNGLSDDELEAAVQSFDRAQHAAPSSV